MPLNVPGLLVPFQLLFYPRLALPAVVVKDIRQLDWAALKAAGYRGAVFDKDNCLTIPYKDTLVPQLQEAWAECLRTFGTNNVIIVSNSAGTHLDPGGIQSESVSHHLAVRVLNHASLKPSYSCIKSIRTYFASLPTPLRDGELIVVGDRVFTDVVMANRMGLRRGGGGSSTMTSSSSSTTAITDGAASRTLKEEIEKPGSTLPAVSADPNDIETRGPLSIWTTGTWKKESMAMRWCEAKLVERVRSWTGHDPSLAARLQNRFVKPEEGMVEKKKDSEEVRRPWYWPPSSVV